MRYSFIIPVYNRPEEVDELLNSLTRQTNKNFEVLVVEDGSSVPCKEVVDNYADRLDICYYFKSNSGPGQTRNYGAERGMENILSYWILIVFCLKGIWRLSSQSFNSRRRMLLVVLTVLMIRLPIYRKQ